MQVLILRIEFQDWYTDITLPKLPTPLKNG